MKLPASHVTMFCTLALICQLSACSRQSETPQKVAEAPEGAAANTENRKIVLAPTGLAGVGVAVAENPATVDTKSKRGKKLATEATAHELLEEYLWLMSTDDPGYNDKLLALSRELSERAPEMAWAMRERLLGDESQAKVHAQQTWQNSEREALINLLLSLDEPEIEGIALELLASEPGPMDVWALGRYLEREFPGKYANRIRIAAEASINAAAESSVLPGELFQILGETGNSSTVKLLSDMPAHRDAYVTVAMSLILDGSGMPFVEQEARLSEFGNHKIQSRLAIELLASQAHRHKSAAEVLLDLAANGSIPKDIRPHVLEIVSGHWAVTLAQPTHGLMEAHTIYRPKGDQIIYRTVVRTGHESSEVSAKRNYLRDQLHWFFEHSL